MSNLVLYIIGFIIIIGGAAWGAFQLGIQPTWIAIGGTILLGIGVVSGVSKTRYREPSPEDPGTRRVIVDDQD